MAISAVLKKHAEHVYEINIICDCKNIETVYTYKTTYKQQIQDLINRYGNLRVTELEG